MKTIFILSLMLGSSLALACGSSDKSASTDETEETKTSQEVVSN